MKKAYIIVQAHNGRSMLRDLRKAGLLHIDTQQIRNDRIEGLEKSFDQISQIRSSIEDLQDKKTKVQQLSLPDEAFVEVLERYQGLLDSRKKLEEEMAHDKIQIDSLKAWGDFDPDQVRSLAAQGIKLFFYTLSKKDLERLDSSIEYLRLAPVGGLEAIATVGSELPPEVSATRFFLPEHGLGFLQKRLASNEKFHAQVLQD
jgi:V/A-type H+-transporting ATPase subunit I